MSENVVNSTPINAASSGASMISFADVLASG
jgi:hypothetical protein